MMVFDVCKHRDIEKHKSRDDRPHAPWLSQQQNYYQVLLLLCVSIIVVICVVYLRSTWQAASALRRVPTMSYYMLDAESGPSSVRIDRSRSYSQLSRSLYSS